MQKNGSFCSFLLPSAFFDTNLQLIVICPMHGKVVVITGASSGIGRALAETLAANGNKVVMGARNIEVLHLLEDRIREAGGEAISVATDVTSRDECARLIQTAVDAYGKLDVLINNAGISMRALFGQTDLSVLHKLMDVNFWGAVYCSHFAMPHLLASKGSLVGISSIAGYKGLPGRAGYSSSKFALQGFLDVVRTENLKTGLHVLTACPGFTASNIRSTALAADGSQQGESPRKESKMMSAEMVAKYIIKAIDKRKRSLVLTTQGKFTVLLNKFLPSLTDRLVYKHMAKEPGSPFK